jgi:hypothetical protein
MAPDFQTWDQSRTVRAEIALADGCHKFGAMESDHLADFTVHLNIARDTSTRLMKSLRRGGDEAGNMRRIILDPCYGACPATLGRLALRRAFIGSTTVRSRAGAP